MFQDQWKGSTERGGIIATMTNVLKPRCRFDYCLNLQANEIVHEAAAAQIRDLPMLYPDAEMFRLPFLTLLGTGLSWHADFRRRLFKNSPYIVSKADGFDCGYEPRLLWASRASYIATFCTASGIGYLSVQAHLSLPGAVPEQYLTKLEERLRPDTLARLYPLRELEYARRIWAATDPSKSSPDEFWTAMREFFDDAMWRDSRSRRTTKDVPRRMVPFPGDPPQVMSRLRRQMGVRRGLKPKGVEHREKCRFGLKSERFVAIQLKADSQLLSNTRTRGGWPNSQPVHENRLNLRVCKRPGI